MKHSGLTAKELIFGEEEELDNQRLSPLRGLSQSKDVAGSRDASKGRESSQGHTRDHSIIQGDKSIAPRLLSKEIPSMEPIPKVKLPGRLFRNGYYSGECLERGSPQGYGLFLSLEGSFFVGDWAGGRPHGKGYQFFSQGGFFFGEIRGGVASGRGLVCKKSEQTYYEGTFEGGRLEGEGLMVYKNRPYRYKALCNKIIHMKELDPASLPSPTPPANNLTTFEEEYALIRASSNPLSASPSFPSSLYRGETLPDGSPQGVGSIFRPQGGRFHGQFNKGRPEGFGVSVSVQGDLKFGVHSQGALEVFGMVGLGKDLYIGGLNKGAFHGPGLYFDADYRGWLLGIFRQGELLAKAYSAPRRLSSQVRKLDKKLLATILDLVYERGAVEESPGQSIDFNLLGEEENESSSEGPHSKECVNEKHEIGKWSCGDNRELENLTEREKYENRFFCKSLSIYLQGREKVQAAENQKFEWQQWQRLDKGWKQDTSSLYKQLFKPFQDSKGSSQSTSISFKAPQFQPPSTVGREEQASFSFRQQRLQDIERRLSPCGEPVQEREASLPPRVKQPNFAFLSDL